MQELRKIDWGRLIPVMVITAKDLTEEDYRRLSGLVACILQKGETTKDELHSEVRSLMNPQQEFEI